MYRGSYLEEESCSPWIHTGYYEAWVMKYTGLAPRGFSFPQDCRNWPKAITCFRSKSYAFIDPDWCSNRYLSKLLVFLLFRLFSGPLLTLFRISTIFQYIQLGAKACDRIRSILVIMCAGGTDRSQSRRLID